MNNIHPAAAIAAPDLLAACERALDSLKQRIESVGDEEDCDFIRAAIAKAKGTRTKEGQEETAQEG